MPGAGGGAELVKLELEAYTAVLRAFAAQQMNWAREKLLSEMRRELHISSDMHINITDKVMNDEELTAIRDGKPVAERRSTGGANPGERRGRPARGRPPAVADATPVSAPRRTDSRRRDTVDMEAADDPPERGTPATGSSARNRSKRKLPSGQQAASEVPYSAARMEATLNSGTSSELEGMRDSLAQRAAQLLAEILATVAPPAEYPDARTRLNLHLQELNTREQSLRRRLDTVA